MATPTTAGKFSYSAISGLLYDNEPRLAQAALLRRLLSPELVTVKWLKSQLAHYAIKPSTGTKDELEVRLKAAVTDGKVRAQPKEVREIEKGLKAAFEAKGAAAGRKSAPKKKKETTAAAPVAAAVRKTAQPGIKKMTTTTTAGTARKSTTTSTKKQAAALDSALAAAARPRAAFADQLIGTYSVTCGSFPSYASSLLLFRHALEPKLAGTLNLGDGQMRVVCVLDWLPMAKQSRVPFVCESGHRGEMEFSAGKGGVRVKGRIETGRWGEVEWLGVKTGEGEGGNRAMKNAW